MKAPRVQASQGAKGARQAQAAAAVADPRPLVQALPALQVEETVRDFQLILEANQMCQCRRTMTMRKSNTLEERSSR